MNASLNLFPLNTLEMLNIFCMYMHMYCMYIILQVLQVQMKNMHFLPQIYVKNLLHQQKAVR